MTEKYVQDNQDTEIPTVDQLQEQINTILQAFKANRKVIGNTETELWNDTEFTESGLELQYLLNTLPKEVKSVTVNVDFIKVTNPKVDLDYTLRTLQRNLSMLDPTLLESEKVHAELTVLPPIFPAELKMNNTSFGSHIRDLVSHEVRDTIFITIPRDTTVMMLKPWGAIEQEKFFESNRYSLSYQIPIPAITGIRLNIEEIPLTPYFNQNGDQHIEKIEVNYPNK
jgi:hypothetical protein